MESKFSTQCNTEKLANDFVNNNKECEICSNK